MSQAQRENKVALMVGHTLVEAGTMPVGFELTDDLKPTNKLHYTDEQGYTYSLTVRGTGWKRPETEKGE